ncbi:MAG: hypothetical protein HQM10_12015 [Candidatus Riflebacteria bacterium]|nr:hypothetical protein [Candidatus Riflebacteria bacterium]
MRTKLLIVCFLLGVLVLAGCDNGGSDGTTEPSVTTVSVLGNVEVPVSVLDGWASSIKASFDFSRLTASAYGQSGNLITQSVVRADKSFSLTLPAPDNEVTLKITSAKGFEMSKLLGAVQSSGVYNVTVDPTSTCQLLLQKEYGLDPDTSSAAFSTLFTAFVNALTLAPGLTSGTVVDTVKISNYTTMMAFRTAQDSIKRNFTWIESALKAKNISETTKYFSPYFTSSDLSLVSVVTFDNFRNTTQDRFNHFSIDSYTINIDRVLFTNSTTAVAYGNANIAVTGTQDGIKQYAALPNLSIIWRLESGNWIVYKDFPFLKTQLGF